MSRQLTILNIAVDNIRFDEFVSTLKKGMVFTPNMDHLLRLQSSRRFYEAYRSADHVVCDSRIVQWFSWLLFPRGGISEIITGSDLLPAYCRYLAKNDTSARVHLLGGTTDTVQAAQRELNKKCGREIVTSCYSPPFGFENDDEETARIVDNINHVGATVLAVGVGSPKQELWIHRNRKRMPGVKVFLAVGAAIEFEGGGIKRAPRWMNKIGLEWLFRLLQEPRRLFHRYLLEDPKVIGYMIKQRFGRYRNPWS